MVGIFGVDVALCIAVTVIIGGGSLNDAPFGSRAHLFSAAMVSEGVGILSAVMVGFDALSAATVAFGTDTLRDTVACVGAFISTTLAAIRITQGKSNLRLRFRLRLLHTEVVDIASPGHLGHVSNHFVLGIAME